MNAVGPSDQGRPCRCSGPGVVGCFASAEEAEQAGSLKLAGLVAARSGFFGAEGVTWRVRVTSACPSGRAAFWFHPGGVA